MGRKLMGRKLSVSLGNEESQLLDALVVELGAKNVSAVVQEALRELAKQKGYVLVPAHVERINNERT